MGGREGWAGAADGRTDGRTDGSADSHCAGRINWQMKQAMYKEGMYVEYIYTPPLE